MTDAKLPFCITSICRNEVDLIPRYCDSIEKAFGKIGETIDVILVDTGSTDDTVKVARERGVTVYEHGDEYARYYSRQEARHVNQEMGSEVVKTQQRVFCFDLARNAANGHATTKWCLSLDICDLVERATIPRILAAIKTADGINGLRTAEIAKLQEQLVAQKLPVAERAALNRKIDEVKAKIIWGYTYRLRYGALIHQNPLEQSTTKLYDRTLPDAKWRCTVHEVFSACGNSRSLPKDLDGKDALIVRHAQRPEAVHNYLPGLAYAYLVRKGDSQYDQARLLYYFAREMYYRGLHGSPHGSNGAKKYLNKVMESKISWIKERSAAGCHLAECYDTKLPNTFELRRSAYVRSIALYPGWREPYLKLAGLAWEQSDYAGCAAYAEAALKIPFPSDTLFAENSANYTTEPYRMMYIAYTRLAQQFVEAGIDCREILQRALDIEEKDGCDANVHVYGWKLAYTHWLPHNKAKAKEYFDKCYLFDSKNYEPDRRLFYAA